MQHNGHIQNSRWAIAALALVCAACLSSCSNGADGSDSAPLTTTAPPTLPPATTTQAYTPESTDPVSQTTPAPETTTAPVDTAPTTTSPSQSQPPAVAGDPAVVALAKQQVGKPFEMGRSGPDAFDNPGLVAYCFKEADGKVLPRRTAELVRQGTEVAKADLQKGDVVFFSAVAGAEVSFCGIYVGDDQFIAATKPDSPVKVFRLNTAYWNEVYITARRL